jgi:N-acyl-L-homoserine lactone synthetase
MKFNTWLSKKPKFNKECLVIAAHKFRDEWEYQIYQVKKAEFGDKLYWALLSGDGEENDSIDDFVSQKYYLMELLK